MSENLQEVRREIVNTRRALGEKIARLEDKIETTKNTTLNPAYHVQKRPWPTLGAFALVGWFVGRSLRGKGKHKLDGKIKERESGMLSGILRGVALGAAGGVGRIAGDFVHDLVKQRNRRSN